MRAPRHPLVSGAILVALLLVALGRCNRAQQHQDSPSTTRQAALAPIVDVGSVSIDLAAQGAIGVGEREAWVFAGTEGQRIAIAAYSAWDNHVALLMPDGMRTLAEDGFSGGNGQGRISGVTLPVTGTYRIVVRGESGDAGNYELSVGEAAPAASAIMTSVGEGEEGILISR